MPSITNLRKWNAGNPIRKTAVPKKPVSARDLEIAKNKSAVELAQITYRLRNLSELVVTLTEEVAVADTDVRIATEELTAAIQEPTTPPSQVAIKKQAVIKAKDKRTALSGQLAAAKATSTKLLAESELVGASAVKAATVSITATAAGAYSNTAAGKTGAIMQNASAAKEAYFSQQRSFLLDVMSPNNQPAAVSAAKDLWGASSSNKGMIVTSEQVLKAWNSGSNKPATASYFDNHNYGFMFHYNPGSVSMSYYTAPNVDVTMITSGQEMFNLAGTSSSQGSISFQVVLNRIADMQYYTPSGALKSGKSFSDIYSIPPLPQDARLIHEMGTMYDLEYLLRVLMGTTMSSYLRGNNTADMGWLPAIPVELHLGKSMRYLGTVASISVNHSIFDARMVPLFSTVDISFARLPDYPASGSTATASISPNSTAGIRTA